MRSIQTIDINASNELDPFEINGKGMPFVGSRPVTTPIFRIACNEMSKDKPKHKYL